jgi:hypothetical protein
MRDLGKLFAEQVKPISCMAGGQPSLNGFNVYRGAVEFGNLNCPVSAAGVLTHVTVNGRKPTYNRTIQ